MARMRIAELLRRHHGSLTPAERRVAEAIVADPESVAFGTVASLAARATTGGATVLRLASKLELDGYSELQALVREELSNRLRPAVERIREPAPGDALTEARRIEASNLIGALDQIDETVLKMSVDTLSDPLRQVGVVASAASHGLAVQFTTELSALRRDVQQIHGNAVDTLRAAATMRHDGVVVAVDFHRYDAWLLDVLDALPRSVVLVAISDSPISPLAMKTELAFVVPGQGVGPFDSWVGALAVLQMLSAGVAAQLVDPATELLDSAELAWRDRKALLDD